MGTLCAGDSRRVRKKTSSANSVYSEPQARGSGAVSDAAERPFHDLRKALHNATAILSLRRWAFFIPFCVISAAAFVASLYFPRAYVASARFERRDDPILIDLPTTEGIGSFSYFRQTLERDVVAPDAFGEALETLGMGPPIQRLSDGRPASQTAVEAAVHNVAPLISVTSKERTPHLDLVEIKYTGPDPAMGVRLVDELKNKYIQRTQARIREVLVDKRDWYTTRLADATERFNNAQKNLTLLRMENPGIDPSNPGTLTERIDDLGRERRELELQKRTLDIELHSQEQILRGAQMRLHVGNSQVVRGASPSSGTLLSSEAIRIASRIKDLDKEIEQLRVDRGMKDEHPEMAQLRGERARLEEQLNKQRALDQQIADSRPDEAGTPIPEQNADPTLVQWQQENDRVKVQIDALRQQIAEIDGRMTAADQKVEQLTLLREHIVEKQEAFALALGDVSLTSSECERYRNVLGCIEPVLAANEQGKAVIFTDDQPARGSQRPVSPQTKTIILIALMLGVCSGVVSVILSEVADHVCRSSHQVARSIGLTVLDTIDVIVTSADRRRNLFRRLVLAPAVVAFGLTLVGATGAIAFLSVEHPGAYEKVMSLPNRLLERLDVATTRTPNPGAAAGAAVAMVTTPPTAYSDADESAVH